MSLTKALADLAAGRPVAASDFLRIERLCRQVDAEELSEDDTGAAEFDRESLRPAGPLYCGRCGTLSRRVYCPTCGDRLVA